MSVDTNSNYSPIFGNGSDNTLYGTSRSEVFSGKGGEDQLYGRSGSDLIYGGSGDDYLLGENGNDLIYGGGGPKYAELNDFTIAEDRQASIVFIDEGAGYRNALGMYNIGDDGAVSNVQILFPNSSKAGSGGELIPGESSVEIDFQAGDKVGFFVVSNGFGISDNNRALLSDTQASFELRNGDGASGNVATDSAMTLWHVDQETGEASEVRSQYGHDIYHSATDPANDYSPNPDNYLHVVGQLNTVTGEVMLGFEDLRGGGDNDYDDVVFRLDLGTTNTNALVPVSSPPPNTTEDDTIFGGDGADEAYGMAGNDYVSGDDGNDQLWGNSGNDELHGGSGDDELRGGKGDDVLVDGTGNDIVHGDSGDDLFRAGAGTDEYVGGSGFDTIDLSDADRYVDVNLHSHKIHGMGTDSVWGVEAAIGTDFDDKFKGDKRDNQFTGGNGDDYFRGLGGDDIMNGGAGNDIYDWAAKDIVGSNGDQSWLDTITDFTTGDRLDFTGLTTAGIDLEDQVRFSSSEDGTIVSVLMSDAFVNTVELTGWFDMSFDDSGTYDLFLV